MLIVEDYFNFVLWHLYYVLCKFTNVMLALVKESISSFHSAYFLVIYCARSSSLQNENSTTQFLIMENLSPYNWLLFIDTHIAITGVPIQKADQIMYIMKTITIPSTVVHFKNLFSTIIATITLATCLLPLLYLCYPRYIFISWWFRCRLNNLNCMVTMQSKYFTSCN